MEARRTRKVFFILGILLIGLCLFLPGINRLPITDVDESYFAQATKQMLEAGDYFSVKFQNQTRYQKPPGINWLQAASNKLFAKPPYTTTWPYRIPSVLGGLLCMLTTFLFTLTWKDKKTAFLASLVVGSSALVVIESHPTLSDAMLLGVTTIQQAALGWLYIKKRPSWLMAALFWLSMNIGIAIKGVTPLIAGLTILSLLLISKDLFPQLAGAIKKHKFPPGYFTLLSIFMLWPVSLHLVNALRYGWQTKAKPLSLFLLAWIVPN